MSLLPGFKLVIDRTSQINIAMDARRKWLRIKRKILGWSIEEMAKKLEVFPIEYELYEEGKIENLPNYDFEDIKFFLESNIRARSLDHGGRINLEGEEW